MEAVWIALIVAVPALLGPILVARTTNKQRRLDKIEDWAREDAVAAKAVLVAEQAAEAARLLRVRTDEVASKAEEAAALLLEANERVAKQTSEVAKVTTGKLNQIHELVNSNMTIAIEDQLLANEQLLVVLVELAQLRGSDAAPETTAAIIAAKGKIRELQSRLTDRAEATKLADAQVERESKASTNV
jgi:hypothetical protein